MSGAKGKARQQRAQCKARKAKGREQHQRTYRTWLDRKKPTRSAPPKVNPFGAGLAQAEIMARLTQLPQTDNQEAAERFLCRLFGEEYRP